MNGPPVRIGCVRYLNTLPLVQGLSAWRDAQVVSAVPSRLIGLLLEGRIDLGLVSVVDVACSPEPLAIIPAGLIGCDGPTLTVRLYSAVPMERVRRLHADTDSHTSVALARIILARTYGRGEVEVAGFDASGRAAASGGGDGAGAGADGWPETLLLIGDKVVTDAPPEERYPHALDLGQAWKDLTGLPFVYAAWMCRAAALREEASAARIRAAAAVLDRARRRNRMRADWVAAAGASARGWPEDLARRYVGAYLRYDVGAREREAVERFLGEAAALGLAPASAPAWADL
jgi:chorismate dehydratase